MRLKALELAVDVGRSACYRLPLFRPRRGSERCRLDEADSPQLGGARASAFGEDE